MNNDDNPDTARAKMIALLCLLDVLENGGDMSAIGIERVEKVGTFTGGPRAGKLRLKFTVFADERRTIQLTDTLKASTSRATMISMIANGLNRDAKLSMALNMIEAWSDLARRLIQVSAPIAAQLEEGTRQLPSGNRTVGPPCDYERGCGRRKGNYDRGCGKHKGHDGPCD